MKRFYKEAAVRAVDGGWEVLLDGRPVRTPARHPLLLPTERLARAVATEWNAQGEKIDPRAMPFTGLANAAIDRVAPDKEAFAATLARYGESDLLCYRADHPAALADRQARVWDPLIAWARRRFDVDFEIVCGVMHRSQPEDTARRLAHAVAARPPFELAALSPLVTIAGSLLIALAVAEEAIDLDTAWSAAALDEQWQAEQWGEDAEAAAVLANRRAEFESAERFLRLL
ncbi:MAG: ATP12 family chaperone protein [Allosphingosinicella sp.]|uniref:ATP12 family chaperone protein n=1 Tax=Allosphingosinicella sp. TaxID=2823234 RepID=UPI0039448517